MNNNLRRFILRKKYRISIVSYLVNLFNNKTYFKEVESRETVSLFEFRRLSAKLPHYFFDRIPGSNLYGASYNLKKYAGMNVKKDIHAYIEHGVYFGSYVSIDSKINYTNKIITFGHARVKNLEKETSKNVFPVGPYIHYATPLLTSEEFISLKNSLGKTLLIFPSHSIENIQLEYDIDYFLDEIDKIKSRFNSVLCCLYFLDARNEHIVKKYQDRGYKIVCAGHKYDFNFLRRLKSIINLADETYSNAVGTHIGYCTLLGKKHRIIAQKIAKKGYSKELKIRDEMQTLTLKEDQERIINAFSVKINEQNQKGNKELVDNYWGVNQIKTPAEIRDILLK